MVERMVTEEDVLSVLSHPEEVEANRVHGGRLLQRYLRDWDRILVVAVTERSEQGVVLVKTVLWSQAS